MFKIGDKVKVPKTKSIGWGLESSGCITKAKKNHQDFLYIKKIYEKGQLEDSLFRNYKCYGLAFDMEDSTSIFLLEDLIPYDCELTLEQYVQVYK